MTDDPKRQTEQPLWKATKPEDFAGDWNRTHPDKTGNARIQVEARISVQCKNFPAKSEFRGKTFDVRWNKAVGNQSGYLEFENTHNLVTTTYRIKPHTPRGTKKSFQCGPVEGGLPEYWEAEEGGGEPKEDGG